MEVNEVAIEKLKEKVQGMRGPINATDEDNNPISWDTQYQQQIDLKNKLEKSFKQLAKQNKMLENALEKPTNVPSEDYQQSKLKALTEDLRVWKHKVAVLATQLNRDREIRKD